MYFVPTPQSIESAVEIRSTTVGHKKTYAFYLLAIAALYIVIAAGLAVWAPFGILDERFHLQSSLPFVTDGITYNTLYHHVPPTGVSSHIWYALWLRIWPNLNFVGLRLTTCIAWGFMLLIAYSYLKNTPASTQKKLLAATLVTLAFPYFFMSTGTLMTEGPALLFVVAGLLAIWASRWENVGFFVLGCLLLGLATVARFYYIPLLPALLVTLLIKRATQRTPSLPYGSFVAAIALALVPLGYLIMLWKGITPPMFHHWSSLRSGISFHLLRPFTTLVLMGLYVSPFVLVNLSWQSAWVKKSLYGAVFLALTMSLLSVNLLNDPSVITSVSTGPVGHVLLWIKAAGSGAVTLSLFVLYSIAFFSIAAVAQLLVGVYTKRGIRDSAGVYSVLFVLFFVGAQAFVGGNHPFYERYLIHLWPFMGYLLAIAFPQLLNRRTYAVLAAYTVFAIVMVVRWKIEWLMQL